MKKKGKKAQSAAMSVSGTSLDERADWRRPRVGCYPMTLFRHRTVVVVVFEDELTIHRKACNARVVVLVEARLIVDGGWHA